MDSKYSVQNKKLITSYLHKNSKNNKNNKKKKSKIKKSTNNLYTNPYYYKISKISNPYTGILYTFNF